MLAGKENMEGSYIWGQGPRDLPHAQSDGLVGPAVYYDCAYHHVMRNDRSMNVALVVSAVRHCAVAANYCEMTGLQHGVKTP